MPAQLGVRQEFVSPEVASQYADIKEGIMQAGTRPWEDVRYKGPQLAGFTDMEAAYQAGVGALGTGEGPQGTRQAEATIGEAAKGIGQVAAAAGQRAGVAMVRVPLRALWGRGHLSTTGVLPTPEGRSTTSTHIVLRGPLTPRLNNS